MNIKDCYKIGLITRPHGLKGEVNVQIEPGIPNDFSTLDAVFALMKNELVPLFIQKSSVRGSKAYVKFEDIDTIEKAEAISKSDLFLPKAARPNLKKGAFYDDEIKNFVVEDRKEGLLGKVADIVESGLQRVIVVQGNDRELLIPINAPFILEVKKRSKKIIIELPDGFLDI